MGDIDWFKVDKELKHSGTEIMENNHFTQLIKEPTKITVNTNTLIDRIFNSHPGKVSAVKFPKIILSDYFPTILAYKDSFGKKHSHTSIECYFAYWTTDPCTSYKEREITYPLSYSISNFK